MDCLCNENSSWHGMMPAYSAFICTGCQKKNCDVLKSIAITLILDYGNENVLALVLKISNVPRFAIFIHIFVIHLKSLRNLFF